MQKRKRNARDDANGIACVKRREKREHAHAEERRPSRRHCRTSRRTLDGR